MQDVITIGETMVLMTPSSSPMVRYAEAFSKSFGGAETNVAIGLARLGHQVGWISKLGNDEFGDYILHEIRGEGIDVSQVKRSSSHPTGLYFKEIRHAGDVRVSYYRKGSAASTISEDDLNKSYLKNAKYLHVTGITPALSESAYQAIITAMKIAREHGVKVIFDPNLRRKLWAEDKAKNTLIEMATLADVILPGMEEAAFLVNETEPERAAKKFLDLGCEMVVIKLGDKGAFYQTLEKNEYVAGYDVKQVIDPVGAGDGFVAGLISGFLDNLTVHNAVKRANAIGAIQTQVQGDYQGLPNKTELTAFMSDSNDTDVKR